MKNPAVIQFNGLNALLEQHLPSGVKHKALWQSINNEALAHSLSLIKNSTDQTILVICENSEKAELLEQQLSFFLNSTHDILHFPDWETLPYDIFSPHQDIISQRLRCLVELQHTQRAILVSSINSLMQPLSPQSYIDKHTLILKRGQELSPQQLTNKFCNAGYSAVNTVHEHGEFVSRGSIIDVFPMGSKQPIRIDFIGDEIDSLRYFDSDTQLSANHIDDIALLPRYEFPLDDDAQNNFLDQWHEYFNDGHNSVVYNDMKQGIASPGLEYYLPLFFEQCANLLDFLPSNSLIFYHQQCHQSAQQYWNEIVQRYDERRHDKLRPILAPQQLFFSGEQIFANLKQYRRVVWDTAEHNESYLNTPYRQHSDLSIEHKQSQPLLKFEHYLEQPQTRFLLCVYSTGRRVALQELLKHQGIDSQSCDNWDDFLQSNARLNLCSAPIEHGFLITKSDEDQYAIAVISEDLIFGRRPITRSRHKKNYHTEATLRHISELKENTHIVHINHGIGLYKGLRTLAIDGQDTELLLIEYADQTNLYVPVSALHMIHHYHAQQSEHVALDKLGNEQWQKSKRKAAEKIHDVAVELLHTYAAREARQGYQYSFDELAYERFSNEFSFSETDDQLTAIKAVINDMRSSQPMDRLVCGDVGFGKTEVAMRAAFVAVHSSKQVAVLVPTTLLAQQHFENFRDRFANWPVNIAVLSRFNSSKQSNQVKSALAAGKIDIVIGTHKLLQQSIQYKNLGLMIVDEEHRFGVRQKEKVKALKAEIDILTLTATPIPRTLNMSLHAMRDLSIMSTPPARRLSVKTFVRAYDEALIKEAILRELLRGGQVFFLHNDIKTMEQRVEQLQELVPEARINFAHGQMREKELERIMADFYHKRSNILVCSTIIETGIDIPSANTIIIERADKFGLAQLHQLRGRVGRSHHQAYAYLLTPKHAKVSKDAEKRLLAIQEASDLGAGFLLAQHDLEIRGAGELLGEEQSGQIQKIGFSLYMQLLEETISSIREGQITSIDEVIKEACEINLNIPALIPEDYLPDPHNRLLLYKRIAEAADKSALEQLKIEMIDRFGLLTSEINQLFAVTQIKIIAIAMGIDKIIANHSTIQLVFSKHTKVDPIKIVNLVQQSPHQYKLKGSDQLQYLIETPSPEQRIEAVVELLQQLD